MNKIVMITGATAGFGKASAELFAANKYNLIITGRRKERLDALQTQLEKQHGVQVMTLCFDVQDKEAVFQNIESLPEDWKNIDVLLNNAGLALGRDYFEDAKLEDWETMIDTNVKGLMYVSKAVVPYMIKRKKGHIINLGSIAGKEVYEKGNGYCASKFAVQALSQSMRIDLVRYGIKVTAIHPGAAETEFSIVRFKGDDQAAAKMYDGYKPLTAEDVANTIFFAANLPAHVCVNELEITCTAQANSFVLFRQ